VRSIFKGEVTLVSEIASFGQVVIIKHGTFRTVYANLNKLFVEEGDQVETLQNIGTVKTNRSTGDTQLYFQIYKDYTPVNPSRWIAQK
jgi:murein DD-endopeptidase MepM/ murein hydrolase activator NlpD